MKRFVRPSVLVLVGVLPAAWPPLPVNAQDGAVHLAARPVAARNHPAVALDRLAPLLGRDADAARLRRAAQLALDAALLAEADDAEQLRLLALAEGFARKAVARNPHDPDARFVLGAALGTRVRHVGLRDKLRLAGEVSELADAILEASPGHPGGLHLRGQLNAAAMRMSGKERLLGRTFMGAEFLSGASWETAEASFQEALAGEPDNPAHRWELALLLEDTGRAAEAREQLRLLVDARPRGPVGELYRERARARLSAMP